MAKEKNAIKVKHHTPEMMKARRETHKANADEVVREEIVRLSLMKKEAESLGFTSLASKYAARIEELSAKLEG